jgi:hypothetical protein
MRSLICVLLAALICAASLSPPANAATPEQAYIAARDAAIAKIKAAEKAEKRGPTDNYGDAILKMDEEATAGLEQQMRAIVGPVVIKGMEDDKGATNLDTLFEGDEGFGLLDGMIYGAPDARTRVIVTTDTMFAIWLREHKNWFGSNAASMPQQPSAAVRTDDFYSQAVLTDAAIMRFAELPVRKPAAAAFAFAMLAARSQSDVPPQADEIFVAAALGKHVFVANTKEFAAVGPIAACDRIRNDLIKKSEDAAQEPGLDDEARLKKSEALSAKSEAEFLRCFAAQASHQNGFAAAVTAAQTLLDRLPPR